MNLETIASNYNNWVEHFDVDGEMTREEFEAMSFDDRMALLRDAFE